MTSLVLAALFLLVTHFSSSTPLRPAVVRRIGEKPWLGLYSLVSFAAFTWLIVAWRAAPIVWIRPPSVGARHALLALMPLSVLLVVAGALSPNPATVMKEGHLGEEPSGVLRITRHPTLWGTGLWAVLHMAANPDVASWWMFGAIGVLSFAGMSLQDHKKRRDLGIPWRQWEAATSVVPFAAIIAGRTRMRLDGGLAWHVGIAAVVYAAVLFGHPWIAGVDVVPR